MEIRGKVIMSGSRIQQFQRFELRVTPHMRTSVTFAEWVQTLSTTRNVVLRLQLLNSDRKVMVTHRTQENLASSLWHTLDFKVYWKHITFICFKTWTEAFPSGVFEYTPRFSFTFHKHTYIGVNLKYSAKFIYNHKNTFSVFSVILHNTLGA